MIHSQKKQFDTTKTHQITTNMPLGSILDRKLLLQLEDQSSQYIEVSTTLHDNCIAEREARTSGYWLVVADLCATIDMQFLSGSLDKSRVHSYGLCNGAFAVPSGDSWWAVPQDTSWPSPERKSLGAPRAPQEQITTNALACFVVICWGWW